MICEYDIHTYICKYMRDGNYQGRAFGCRSLDQPAGATPLYTPTPDNVPTAAAAASNINLNDRMVQGAPYCQYKVTINKYMYSPSMP